SGGNCSRSRLPGRVPSRCMGSQLRSMAHDDSRLSPADRPLALRLGNGRPPWRLSVFGHRYWLREIYRMQQLKLSTLATGVGLIYALPHIYGVLKPAAFAAVARKFPR